MAAPRARFTAVNGPIRILVYNTLIARMPRNAKPHVRVLVRKLEVELLVLKRNRNAVVRASDARGVK